VAALVAGMLMVAGVAVGNASGWGGEDDPPAETTSTTAVPAVVQPTSPAGANASPSGTGPPPTTPSVSGPAQPGSPAGTAAQPSSEPTVVVTITAPASSPPTTTAADRAACEDANLADRNPVAAPDTDDDPCTP